MLRQSPLIRLRQPPLTGVRLWGLVPWFFGRLTLANAQRRPKAAVGFRSEVAEQGDLHHVEQVSGLFRIQTGDSDGDRLPAGMAMHR